MGGIAVQLAKMHGLTVFTTCSTAKVDYVRKHLDVDAVIDYRKEDVTERIGELTDGLGVDLVVDTVSGAEAEKDFDRLAYNGQLVTIVGVPNIDSDDMFGRGLSMAVVNLGGAHGSGDSRQQNDLGDNGPPTCLRWHRRAVSIRSSRGFCRSPSWWMG